MPARRRGEVYPTDPRWRRGSYQTCITIASCVRGVVGVQDGPCENGSDFRRPENETFQPPGNLEAEELRSITATSFRAMESSRLLQTYPEARPNQRHQLFNLRRIPKRREQREQLCMACREKRHEAGRRG